MRDGPTAAQFAKRLRDRMIERGHVSSTNRAGVDIAALARAAHVSLEMARRYVEGLAMPRPEKLPLIARWLDVDPATLLWDEPSRSPPATTIDREVLKSCLAAVMEAQRTSGAALSPSAIASIAATLYAEVHKGRQIPSHEILAQLMRLTSS